MKRFFLDLFLFISGFFVIHYFNLLITSNFKHYDKILVPLLFALFYGSICFAIFTLSIRLFKSKLLFCLSSWFVVLVLLAFKLIRLQDSNLTFFKKGKYTFINGEMTLYGFIDYIAHPITGMAIFATAWLVIHKINRNKINLKGNKHD